MLNKCRNSVIYKSCPSCIASNNVDLKLYNGERVRILEESSANGYTWYRVEDESGRTDGWARADFIEID